MKKYLLRRNKLKNKNLKYDFLPSMLEVIEKPANRAGSIIIVGIFLLIASAVLWAAFFKLDVVVTAAGAVSPQDDLVKVQAERAGIIEVIQVKDGDEVRAGDVIAELEKETCIWSMEDLQYQLELAQIQKEVYEKIYADEDWEEINPEAYGEFSYIVSGILEEQRLYLSQEKEYRLQINQAEDKELARTTLKSYQIRRNMEILQNLSNLNAQIAEGEIRMKQAEENLSSCSIQAPVSGAVSQLQVSHAKEAVNASQIIGYIVPEGAVMVFQCYVKNSEIAYLEVGQSAEVKLEAYPYSEYGTVKGEILYIENIAVNIEGMGAVYPVLISLEEKEGMNYKVGLSGSCDIHVSDRTVLEYFLEPIRKGFGESLDET